MQIVQLVVQTLKVHGVLEPLGVVGGVLNVPLPQIVGFHEVVPVVGEWDTLEGGRVKARLKVPAPVDVPKESSEHFEENF